MLELSLRILSWTIPGKIRCSGGLPEEAAACPKGWVTPSELAESPALVVSEEQGFRRSSASLVSHRSSGKTELVGDCAACPSLVIGLNRD